MKCCKYIYFQGLFKMQISPEISRSPLPPVHSWPFTCFYTKMEVCFFMPKISGFLPSTMLLDCRQAGGHWIITRPFLDVSPGVFLTASPRSMAFSNSKRGAENPSSSAEQALPGVPSRFAGVSDLHRLPLSQTQRPCSHPFEIHIKRMSRANVKEEKV